MKNKLAFFFLACVGTCIVGILGLLIATFFGATAFLDFTAFGLRGYEATGILGLYVGLVAGILITAVLYKQLFPEAVKPFGMVFWVLVALLIVLFAPIRIENKSSFFRTCRFDESSGGYTKCFWSWDKALNEPSVYF